MAVVGEGVLVVVRIGRDRRRIGLSVFLGVCGAGKGTSSASDIVFELSRGLEVGLLYRASGSSGGWLVDREGELHALDGTRTTMEVGLTGTLSLGSALFDDVCGVIPLETRCLQLFNTPNKILK